MSAAPQGVKGKAVLRNVTATTDARYLSRDFRGYLVELPDARRFASARSAEQFLRINKEFVGYRVEVLA